MTNGIALLATLSLFGCATSEVRQAQEVELSAILAHPEAYDGRIVRTEACLSVVIEGMYLLECGTRYPIFDFTMGANDSSRRAVEGLIALGHSMMGEAPEKIRVEVRGVYRNGSGQSRFDHLIELMDFQLKQAARNGGDAKAEVRAKERR